VRSVRKYTSKALQIGVFSFKFRPVLVEMWPKLCVIDIGDFCTLALKSTNSVVYL